MITFFNKLKKKLRPVLMAAVLGSAILLSCDKDVLAIQNDFPFEVEVMPVPKEIANGNTVEIRVAIQPTGNYAGTHYFIRYFQFEGQGALRYYSEPPYQPNDLYPLPAGQFRLYYTSSSAVSQSFEVWISDNFGNEKQLGFRFDSGG